MKKITLLSVIFVFALSQLVMAVPPIKFDLTVFMGLSKYAGIGANDTNFNLRVDSFSGGFAWDVIFLTSESKYYGHGISLLVDVALMNQGFKSSIMIKEQTNNFIGQSNFVQLLSIINIKIAPMYRFHVTRDFNIGIGPAINIIGGAGNPAFITSPEYTTGTTALSNYYIGKGKNIHFSAIADIQFTKFFGNFGVTASLFGDVLFTPITFGFGTRFGVKYRFSP